jgi:ABC-type transport system involved in cytochrome c biogenesis permease component
VLLFPLVVPALICTTRGTLLLIEGDVMGDTPAWLGLLFAFDAIHWSLTGLLFSRIVEET